MGSKIKVVVNTDWGGFGLSDKAIARYCELKGLSHEVREGGWGTLFHKVGDDDHWSPHELERHDPVLVQVVEELGEDASGRCSMLEVEEVDGDRYFIVEYDGVETVYTPINAPWIEAK